jgi:hypothetical protein
VGGVIAAGIFMLFHQVGVSPAVSRGDLQAEQTLAVSGADEAEVAAGPAAAATAAMPPGTTRVVSGTRTGETGATSAEPGPTPPAGPGGGPAGPGGSGESAGPDTPPEGER